MCPLVCDGSPGGNIIVVLGEYHVKSASGLPKPLRWPTGSKEVIGLGSLTPQGLKDFCYIINEKGLALAYAGTVSNVEDRTYIVLY